MKSGNKSYYEGLTQTTQEKRLGKEIMTATIGGTETLKDWYKTFDPTNQDSQTVLKGSMIKLASDYGFSESQYAQYFDAAGNVITSKFEEFIALMEDFEEEERNRPSKDKTIDLINQVKDALVESRQKEIDTLAEKFDAIVEANNRMVDSLQELVNADRQRRENEKTE
jgi:hypothetical protein